MIARRDEIARLQSDFYRLQYYKMLRWLVFCLGVLFLLVLANIYVLLIQPQPKYFANTVDGAILEMPTVTT